MAPSAKKPAKPKKHDGDPTPPPTPPSLPERVAASSDHSSTEPVTVQRWGRGSDGRPCKVDEKLVTPPAELFPSSTASAADPVAEGASA